MIDFESALIYFECDCDGGFVDPRHSDAMCLRCDGQREHAFYLGTLFANLALAGAMQAMFDAGRDRGYYECPCDEILGEADYAAIDSHHWRPNVDGKQVPGWSKP